MKILFLDEREIHVGSKRVFINNMYETLLSLNYQVSLNKKIDETYNVIILGKHLLNESINIRKNLKHRCALGIVNPPCDDILLNFKNVLDFYIVGSIEERDSLLKYNINTIYYPLIETWFHQVKIHKENEELIIGYHGNFEHLKSLTPNINWALEELSKSTKVKLKIIAGDHNGVDKKWDFGKPNIPIEQNTWSPWSIETELLECDIGIVPNVVNIDETSRKYIIKHLNSKKNEGYKSDYILRFKNKSNVGRGLVFMQLGIPVVADFTPCHFDIIKFNETGFLALSKEGWLDAFQRLKDVNTRKRIAKNALDKIKLEYNINIHSTRVCHEIELVLKKINTKK